ncbi:MULTISPECIES: hypothetical protein [Paracoccus]|jgi:4-hydroxymandelate oxidase|uniref:FMN-dependent alpha-hydroxy acid dehydrogenase n=1 Tax=Paracoccus denitrificans (strain Pd 1222) TaxID=318586 RepID=A1BA92_PARDP|nr:MULTISPECIES: hypothetical protein [Paracoccus]ABL72436.1 hypothetical protein Pden_4372 [Paracoccus denitrificans PD1222]MBB4628568.1 4-hydroxymandelate oxidase [Paracoccus denitrificans]MCU7430539.1 alpha-hydroxy-acid oxidizing protein [Paracoccus denitrificans]MDK8873862.1 hypothetical protein [Paracoccus sp. SSJ]UFS66834.1 alpha-hydroxy-acid oxidizing protein [Paracoccus denitrificans]
MSWRRAATRGTRPVVARQVAVRIPVLCDGGIRRGGGRGYADMLTILRAELEVAMALTGRRDLAGIDEGVIRPSP